MYQSSCLEQPRTIGYTRQPHPDPAPQEVRIRVQGCGLCGSNLSVWQGKPWFTYPLSPGQPGHEGWGIVDKIGSGTFGVQEGERVAFLGQRSFAELECVDHRMTVPIPRELDDMPFPGEALACAMNVFRRCGIASGDWTAVVGTGFLGCLLVQLASHAGARVIALSGRPSALESARVAGASHLLPMDRPEEVLEEVTRLTGGEGCAKVIECTGFQRPLDLASKLTAVRGRLIIAGYHQDGPRSVDLQQWNWKGLDVINAHERDPAIYLKGLEEAIEAVSSRRLNPLPFYSHRYDLGDLQSAFQAMEKREDGFLKAVIFS